MQKDLFRFFAKPRPHLVLAEIIRQLAKGKKSVHIVQIGANDGIRCSDPIHRPLLRHSNVTATRVEGISEYYEELERNCRLYYPRVNTVHACIAGEDGEVEMLLPNPTASTLSANEKGMATIVTKGTEAPQGWVRRTVRAMTMATFLHGQAIPRVDVYVSDVEGYDIQILKQLPIDQLGVCAVYIELRAAATKPDAFRADFGQLGDILCSHGFNQIVWDGFNFLAWRGPAQSTSPLIEMAIPPERI